MMIQVDWVSKIVGLIGAVNLALIALGIYHFSSDQMDAINKVVSALISIIGVWLPHLKGEYLEEDEDGQDNVH